MLAFLVVQADEASASNGASQLNWVLGRPWHARRVKSVGADHLDVLWHVVRMFYREHEPAHFHAEYQGQQAKLDLRGRMIVGNIRSKTALRLIEQWASLHTRELESNWEKMKEGQTLERIEPLD